MRTSRPRIGVGLRVRARDDGCGRADGRVATRPRPTPPLDITLDAPVTCETDAPGWTEDAPEIEFDTAAIGWSVSGGTPPKRS